MKNCPYGYRIVGACSETRRLADAAAAFAGYAALDERCEPNREAYLSAFWFGEDFRELLTTTGSTAGFAGDCWSPWLWFDLDSDELHYAHKDAAALAAFLVERFNVDPAELLTFFSGSKGFHVGLSTALWLPESSDVFHQTARRFAENVAELAAVTVDAGVYDRVRAFRAPNSRHPRTGLHKRRLTFDELLGPLDAILELAAKPAPFTVPTVTKTNEQAAADWAAAAALVAREGEAKTQRHIARNGTPTLNKATMLFIREGADTGDRHRLLFSAAANLGEFGCPSPLAVALLEESGLDSGLPPKDVRRQIACGLAAKAEGEGRKAEEVATAPAAVAKEEPAPAVDMQAALARLWSNPPSPTASLPQGGKVSKTLTVNTGSPHPIPLPKGEGTELPSLPPPLVPLPLGAVGSGVLDTPCRCGSTEFVDVAISEGRSRRDCRKCGRFLGFGKWYENGGKV